MSGEVGAAVCSSCPLLGTSMNMSSKKDQIVSHNQHIHNIYVNTSSPFFFDSKLGGPDSLQMLMFISGPTDLRCQRSMHLSAILCVEQSAC